MSLEANPVVHLWWDINVTELAIFTKVKFSVPAKTWLKRSCIEFFKEIISFIWKFTFFLLVVSPIEYFHYLCSIFTLKERNVFKKKKCTKAAYNKNTFTPFKKNLNWHKTQYSSYIELSFQETFTFKNKPFSTKPED